MFINHQLDEKSRRYDANEWIGIFQGGAKPSVGKGLRAFIDIEAFDNAGSSMGSQGLRASVGHVLDKPLVNYNGFYISTGNLHTVSDRALIFPTPLLSQLQGSRRLLKYSALS